LRDEEVELPGSGFSTEIANVPALLALPVAVSCVADTKVVAKELPETRTVAPVMKLAPVRVSEKVPRLTEEGEIPVRVGVGLRSVTTEELDLEVSAALVAVTETVLGEGREAGAV